MQLGECLTDSDSSSWKHCLGFTLQWGHTEKAACLASHNRQGWGKNQQILLHQRLQFRIENTIPTKTTFENSLGKMPSSQMSPSVSQLLWGQQPAVTLAVLHGPELWQMLQQHLHHTQSVTETLEPRPCAGVVWGDQKKPGFVTSAAHRTICSLKMCCWEQVPSGEALRKAHDSCAYQHISCCLIWA